MNPLNHRRPRLVRTLASALMMAALMPLLAKLPAYPVQATVTRDDNVALGQAGTELRRGLWSPDGTESVKFTDANFANADWTSSGIRNAVASNCSALNAGWGMIASPVNSPPSARRLETTICGPAGSGLWVVNERTAKSPWTFSPGATKISSIDYSLFAYHITAGSGENIAYSILLVQGGVRYRVRDWELAAPADWVPLSKKGLMASDFVKVNDKDPGPLSPDFGCKGQPISFGYVTGNSTRDDALSGYRRDHAIDDLVITVNEEPCTCMTAKVDLVSCANGPSGPSGCYDVKLAIVNYSGQAVTHVLIAPASGTATPNVIPIAIAANDTSMKTITVRYCPPAGVTSGALKVTLVGMPGQCLLCDQTVNFDLPRCDPPTCLWVPKYTASCVPGAPPGTFNLSFGMKNMLDCPAALYLIPRGGAKVSPSYFKGPFPANPGSSNYVGNIRVTGASSSVFCMDVILQCSSTVNCCTKTLCFEVPDCWASPMPIPTRDITPIEGSR